MPLHLDAGRTLTIARAAQLRDQHRLELGDGPKHLTDQHGCRRVVEEGVGLVGGDQFDAAFLQDRVANLLNHQVAGEAIGGLDHDGADAVRQQPLQHRLEGRSGLDQVGTEDHLVVERLDDLDPAALA